MAENFMQEVVYSQTTHGNFWCEKITSVQNFIFIHENEIFIHETLMP